MLNFITAPFTCSIWLLLNFITAPFTCSIWLMLNFITAPFYVQYMANVKLYYSSILRAVYG